MIKEKKSTAEPAQPPIEEPVPIPVPEQVEQNPLAEMYLAVKRAVLTIREREDDPASQPFFKTISIDNGQFSRITLSHNFETEIAFPAIFIHYTNVRYLVQQQRIGEGRATMRVRFILNTLNNQDPERECDLFHIFQRVNQAIQDAKNTEPALSERCQLLYFDMPTTSNMLQAYWIDYEVWFRETAGHGNHPRPNDHEAITIEPSVGGEDPELPAEDE